MCREKNFCFKCRYNKIDIRQNEIFGALPRNTCMCVPGVMYKDVQCNTVIIKNLKELKYLSVWKCMDKLWSVHNRNSKQQLTKLDLFPFAWLYFTTIE